MNPGEKMLLNYIEFLNEDNIGHITIIRGTPGDLVCERHVSAGRLLVAERTSMYSTYMLAPGGMDIRRWYRYLNEETKSD
jgi:hypothetical protein